MNKVRFKPFKYVLFELATKLLHIGIRIATYFGGGQDNSYICGRWCNGSTFVCGTKGVSSILTLPTISPYSLRNKTPQDCGNVGSVPTMGKHS